MKKSERVVGALLEDDDDPKEFLADNPDLTPDVSEVNGVWRTAAIIETWLSNEWDNYTPDEFFNDLAVTVVLEICNDRDISTWTTEGRTHPFWLQVSRQVAALMDRLINFSSANVDKLRSRRFVADFLEVARRVVMVIDSAADNRPRA